jgi:hypothetical protein
VHLVNLPKVLPALNYIVVELIPEGDSSLIIRYLRLPPTFPLAAGGWGGSTSSSVLATPHTVRQLHRKAFLISRSYFLSSLRVLLVLKCALHELIKGCELAIYNAAFTLKELNDLRAENQVQALKKSRSKRQMAPVQGLQMQKARDLI